MTIQLTKENTYTKIKSIENQYSATKKILITPDRKLKRCSLYIEVTISMGINKDDSGFNELDCSCSCIGYDTERSNGYLGVAA